jgi:hypothetical protein
MLGAARAAGKVRVPNSNKHRRPPPVVAALVCALMLGGCAAQPLKFDEASGTYYPDNSADSVAPKRLAKAKSKAPAANRAQQETPDEPDCGAYKSPGRAEPAPARAEQSMTEGAGDANADLALRIKLEYERECYRQAEVRMRDRVKQLQTSTKAAKGSEPSGAASIKR